MKSLLQFLLRNSTFLLFVVLEVLSIILIVHYNEYAQSAIFSSTNRMTAGIYSTCNTISSYFQLRNENNVLTEENTALRNELSILRQQIEEDSIAETLTTSPFSFVAAKIINLTTYQQKNYLTLNKGSKDGIMPNMGVINNDGVVGIVSTVSEHYALVIPILHQKFTVSGKLCKNGEIGTLHWDGKDYRYAKFNDIGRHISVSEGDTIVTSGLSAIFPEGIPIGVIYKDKVEEGDAYHNIDIALCVNFRRLRNVCIIQNSALQEIQQLQQYAQP
ncbi:MAG: rod shape-determining protein MreC [Paludibacter sp.]|nr:rod shape-determining protein MreC [Bacteroidales bacterium]MCM1068544.1 rod shape-determining protein MreC [Prevotella sp.]MCM1353208.1 rod shape-determining protein MreC [Bacteroides sp.]MCM1442384.1 rod shape-determining protein MreC [Muribaculum sp.]MCM1481203.1 rod shape-determining protein MreC [Paludibacter sp.]